MKLVFFFLLTLTVSLEQLTRPSVISQIISNFPFPFSVDIESPVVFSNLKVRNLKRKKRIKQNFKVQCKNPHKRLWKYMQWTKINETDCQMNQANKAAREREYMNEE